MKFDKIILKNFQSFGDEEQSINLNINDLTLITGFNELTGSSNGSGKSVLISAILWVLYGKTRDSADNVINKYTGKKNCKVELKITKNQDKYDIIRYRGHDEQKNKIYVFLNGNDISYDDSRDTQELINRIISVSYDSFVSSIVFGNIYSNFINSTNGKRIEIIENILNITPINDYLIKVKDTFKKLEVKDKEINEKIIKHSSEINTITSNIQKYKESIKRKYADIKEQIANIESIKQQYSDINFEEQFALIEKNNQLNEKLKVLDDKLELIEIKDESQYITKISKIQKEKKNIEDKIIEMKGNIEECPTCHQKVDEKIVLKEIENKTIECNNLDIKIDEIIDEQKNIEKSNLINQEKRNTLIKEKKEIENDLLNNKTSYNKEELEEAFKVINNADNELKSLNTSLETLVDKSFVEEQNKSIKEKNEVLTKEQAVQNKINSDKEYLQYFIDLFGNKSDGLKRFLIKKILPTLNNKVNEYITSYFSYNISIEFDESLKENILIDGEKYSIKELSTGEQRRVEISCMFALFYLVRAYLGCSSNLLILDEVLDIGLDDNGIQATIDILEKMKSEGNSIFIISHRSSFKDYFTNRIKIVKNKKRCSKIIED